MVIPAALLGLIAAALALRARRVARPRLAAALMDAAVGVFGFALGLPAGETLGRVEGADDALAAPLSSEQLDQSLIRQLFPDGAIRTAPPDDRGVCHDWAFGGTRYTDGTSVEVLLADYRPVTRPRPGDVVVYLGPAGEPVHSGRVRAVGRGGLVLIESKWGHQGRYLHLTGISRFPDRHVYYRRAEPAIATPAGLPWGHGRRQTGTAQ